MSKRPMGKATRVAYGETITQLGREDSRIVALDADLSKSTQSHLFGAAHPERFFNVGIAEANMAGIAAGLALSGFIPFVSSFAGFLVTKSFDQMRVAVAYPDVNVKFAGSHGGISIGEDGPSQMAIEDLALALSLPGFTVVVPADEHAARALVRQVAAEPNPAYMRFGRPAAPLIYDAGTEITLGKAQIVREGKEVTIIAVGLLVAEALDAADSLAERGIEAEVIDCHTLRPLDEETILTSVKKTGRVVVCEEHLLNTGLGSVISRLLLEKQPVPTRFVGIENTYAESGKGSELLEKYGLTAPAIIEKVEALTGRAFPK